MSVSLMYEARRATPLTADEAAEVERIVSAREASFPYPDEESCYLYDAGDRVPDAVLNGSTKLPFSPGRLFPVIAHVLDTVTELRRALPTAQWSVSTDDVPVPWDETEGYALAGMRDAELIAELCAIDGE
ncbi:hypothetical protein ACMA1D_06035 [Streptomyces sp. 796.1]|uniref:hypothetical protein n=1 Tax=Streptomyces sp. 796.1 TaxID=3163029 RepID=UPI0039C8C380